MATMTTATDFSLASRSAPKLEAIFLFKLCARTGESPEQMRSLIRPQAGTSDLIASYRARVLFYFNEIVEGRITVAIKKTIARPIPRRRPCKHRRSKPNGRPRKLSDSQIEDARRALASGALSKDVAGRFSVSKPTLIRLGLYARKFKPVKKKHPKHPWMPFSNWRHWPINSNQ